MSLPSNVSISGTASGNGKFNSNAQGGGDLSVSGTIAHGGSITITDALSRLGSRANAKPLYVSLGTQKAGLSLGRLTGDYYHANTAASSTRQLGSITQTYRFDHKGLETANAIWGNENFFTEDATRPLLQYVERYYDFDIYNPIYQAGGQLNIKTNRMWGNWNIDPNVVNIYVGYNGSWAAPDTSAVAPEHTVESPLYIDATLPMGQWMSEEFIMENSSAADVSDGLFYWIRSNTLLNASKTNWVTYTTAMPQKLSMIFLDQISNGSGDSVPNVYQYLGYQCIDDEYRRVYIGNSATRASCTKLIPMPQTAWSAGSVTFQGVVSHLALSGNYAHIRLGRSTWLEAVQL